MSNVSLLITVSLCRCVTRSDKVILVVPIVCFKANIRHHEDRARTEIKSLFSPHLSVARISERLCDGDARMLKIRSQTGD